VKPPSRRDREPRKDENPALEGNIASAADLRPGDRVVYPNQGVCRVAGLEQKDIAGQRLEFVRMNREEDGASVMVPIPKVATIGLRRVASQKQIEGVFHYLGASYDDPELDWKVRHRDNVERLIAGGVLGVAEVVKGLHSLARLRPLPGKERELYDSSRHLLVSEVAVSLGVPHVTAEDYVDYALMPPAGVKLLLKPPPRPVELKGPPWKRKKPAAAVEDELGLADLGIDIGEIEGAAVAGEEAEAGEGAGTEAQAAPPAKPSRPAKAAGARPAKAAAKAVAPARPAREKTRAKKGTAAKARPTARPAERKKERKVAKPAPRRAAKASAKKTGGGKKR
jgi:RNA polymerase-interacting CarD/CdnL/TRCF family regulator